MGPDYPLNIEADRTPLHEPMHQRVAVLEKQIRELNERTAEQEANMRDFADRVARELGF